MEKGFTLIELIIVIAIIAILSGIVLFSITQYINKGKDSNIAGNLVVLIPAGEAYYNANNYSYENFCGSSAVDNAIRQSPVNPFGSCYNSENNPAGICCYVEKLNHQSWAACARLFTDNTKAFCVDSRGIKKEIDVNACNNTIIQCP